MATDNSVFIELLRLEGLSEDRLSRQGLERDSTVSMVLEDC